MTPQSASLKLRKEFQITNIWQGITVENAIAIKVEREVKVEVDFA